MAYEYHQTKLQSKKKLYRVRSKVYTDITGLYNILYRIPQQDF